MQTYLKDDIIIIYAMYKSAIYHEDDGWWVSIGQAADHYRVSTATLRRWADEGKVTARRSPSGQRQYKISPIPQIANVVPQQPVDRTNYIYVRVSSYKQKDDLERQEQFLLQKFPEYATVKDIGSGLSFKRHGLLALLEHVQNNAVGEIVVSSKDRLCRFGFELIEWLCQTHGTRIVVLEQHDASGESELAAELLDVIQVFCCRRNGQRRYSHQKCKDSPKIETASEKNTGDLGASQ